MRKFFDKKLQELRYYFGDDVVFGTIWQYWNYKEDGKEAKRSEVEHQESPQSQEEELV